MRAATLRVQGCGSSVINSRMQWIKRTACGYRNRERFRESIHFRLGGLDLYPARVKGTHTT